MLLEYETTDKNLLAALCEFLLRYYPNVAFSWIPLITCLCIHCPDEIVGNWILADVRSRFNVEPINRPLK